MGCHIVFHQAAEKTNKWTVAMIEALLSGAGVVGGGGGDG